MKRSVLVAAGTAVGVTAVVSYHAAAPSTSTSLASAGSSGGAANTATTSRGAAHSSARTHSASRAHSPSRSPSATTTTSPTTTSSTSSGTRSATGSMVGYPYGQLEVKVTEHGGRITAVAVVDHSTTDPQSQSIDQYAIPQLRQEVLSAQSAHVDGVSGASYTSQAYAQSVQSALDKLA